MSISKKIKEGLEDIISYKQGKLSLRSELIQILEPPRDYKAKDIRQIREARCYSQGIFAKILNVSIKTVQSWESGKRTPSHSVLRLLEIIDNNIYRPL